MNDALSHEVPFVWLRHYTTSNPLLRRERFQQANVQQNTTTSPHSVSHTRHLRRHSSKGKGRATLTRKEVTLSRPIPTDDNIMFRREGFNLRLVTVYRTKEKNQELAKGAKKHGVVVTLHIHDLNP